MTPSSKRRLKLTIDGTPYTVEMGDLNQSPITVSVNGQDYQVQLETDRSSSPDGYEAPPTTAAAPVAPAAPRKAAPATVAASANEITAPMPGDILDIQVKAGDRVEVGDHICSLEAMKMKSAIRTARAGVIASVEVSEGQAVAHGDILVTFEQG